MVNTGGIGPISCCVVECTTVASFLLSPLKLKLKLEKERIWGVGPESPKTAQRAELRVGVTGFAMGWSLAYSRSVLVSVCLAF